MTIEINQQLRSAVPERRIDYPPLNLTVNQIKAAGYVSEVVAGLRDSGILREDVPEHKAVLETDIYRLRRGLCLPSAVSTAINFLLEEKIVGDSEGSLRVGDFFKHLLPFHGCFPSDSQPRGWLVVSGSGDMYHHAAVAFSKGMNLQAYSISDFHSLIDFAEAIRAGFKVAVSLNNRYVLDCTLGGEGRNVRVGEDGTPEILIDGPDRETHFRKFENGRHVVTLVDMSDEDVLISDSFCLPQMGDVSCLQEWPVCTVDKYLLYHDLAPTRAILIGRDEIAKNSGLNIRELVIPDIVVQDLRSKLNQFC